MSINLKKDQVINLSKDLPLTVGQGQGLSHVIVGLGWDPAKPKRGFFGSKSSSNIDCDAFAVECNSMYHISNKDKDVISFMNRSNSNHSIKHGGDNLTGEGDGDDERIEIDLTKVQNDKVVLAVNIYHGKNRSQHFGLLENAFIRLVNNDTNTEICKYTLDSTYDGAITVIFGELYKENGSWLFKAIGESVPYDSIGEMVRGYFK